MVSKMNYDDRYDKALRYIFGRTLICRNLEVATQLAKTNRLDCVTMDGDQVRGWGRPIVPRVAVQGRAGPSSGDTVGTWCGKSPTPGLHRNCNRCRNRDASLIYLFLQSPQTWCISWRC